MSRVNKDGYMLRYFTRWVTRVHANNGLQVIGWEVCDSKKFDKIGMGKYETKEQAEGLCKLLNSIEEESDGLSK
jgi:hypothetical protein